MPHTVHNPRSSDDEYDTKCDIRNYDADYGETGQRVLVVAVANEDSNSADWDEEPSSVTFGSDALTKAVTVLETTGGARNRVGLYYLAAPARETRDIDVLYPTAKNIIQMAAMVVSGVAEQGPESVASQAQASTNSVSTGITTSTADAAVVCAITNSWAASMTPGAGITDREQINDSSSPNQSLAIGDAVGPASPGLLTLSWTLSSSWDVGLVAASFALYGAVATTGARRANIGMLPLGA